MKLPTIQSCDGCGACCMHMRTPPHFPGSRLWRKLTKEMRSAIKARAFTALGVIPENAPCLWLKDGKCEHYDLRPEVCRNFKAGSAACHLHRHDRGIALLGNSQIKFAEMER